MINVTKTQLPQLEKYIKYLEKIWSTHWVTNNGEFVLELESKLTEFLGVHNLLTVANGTLAMQLAFKALALTGEVITTPFTFPATTTALIWEGLTPVFADIDPETFNLDSAKVESKITQHTSAILAVHVYGNPCDVENLAQIAQKHNLKLIYDSAHCFGVKYRGQSVLNYGDVSTLSFHATKTFHTIEGGAVVVTDKKVLEQIDILRNFGIKTYEQVVAAGINAKMNEFQAAMGLCNLENVDAGIKAREQINNLYTHTLGKNPKIRLQKQTGSQSNYSYFPSVFENQSIRDKVYNKLLENDIKARKYFYPLTSDFDFIKNSNQHLEVARKISDCVLCLPIYADLDLSDAQRITKIILKEI